MKFILAVKRTGDCVTGTVESLNGRLKLCQVFMRVLFVCAAISGCATPTGNSPTGSNHSFDAVLGDFKKEALLGSKPKVALISAALSSRSKAFEGDTRLFSQTVSELNSVAPQLSLNNAVSSSNSFEAASKPNVRAALEALAQTVDPQGLAIVLLSSHGGVGLLEMNSRGKDQAPLSSWELRNWLEPLGKTKTLIIISACHSGSFIRALAAPNRIILTAARADRSSFGCNFASGNTYFIEEMLKVNYSPSISINELFSQTKTTVAARELRMRLTPPSEPQAFVGADMQAEAAKPMRELFKP